MIKRCANTSVRFFLCQPMPSGESAADCLTMEARQVIVTAAA